MKKSPGPDLDCKLRTKNALSLWIRQRHYAETDCTAEKAAEQMNLSTLQLKWYLKEEKQTTFGRLKKELRMRDASCLLIMKPRLPLNLVGRLVGECDKANFRRDFKSVMGTYPVNYRKKCPILRLVLFCMRPDLRQVLRKHRLL